MCNAMRRGLISHKYTPTSYFYGRVLDRYNLGDGLYVLYECAGIKKLIYIFPNIFTLSHRVYLVLY